tara:strand:+ start:492 stop:881 length:390 start_codon:yes stop_codon:yes gene_type:complete
MEKILECISVVNKELGNHYKENIYQYALYVELNLKGYLVQTEVIVPIFYKGVYVGFERADVVIYNSDGTIEHVLELKSQNSKLASKEITQLRKYLKNMNCKNGLLINFYEKLEIIKVDKDFYNKIEIDN